jgi:V8-like Glu-specific endopeptidase
MGRWCAWIVLAMGCACAEPQPPGTAEVPIVNGVPDDRDEAVCALVLADEVFCTGTLVAPRVVLTAAHCVRRGINVADAFFGKEALPGQDGGRFPVVKAKAHPAYNDETLANDIGVLLLDGLPGMEPALMNTVAFEKAFLGQTTRLVGFGMTRARGDDEGKKRQTTSVVTKFSASDFTYSGTTGQTCQGDSGGPAFLTLDGKEVLVGVTSWGDEDCTQFGIDTRVDVFVDSFIKPFVDENRDGPTCAADGACLVRCAPLDPDCPRSLPLGEYCRAHGDCASSLCVPAADDSAILYCSHTCHRDVDCPLAMGGVKMRCQKDAQRGDAVCRFPAPTPGAQGWPCSQDSECTGGVCSAWEGERICTRRCDTGPAACGSGTSCQARAPDPQGGAPDKVCVPESSSGFMCRVAPSSRPGARPLALLALAGLCWVGRRRVLRVLDDLVKKSSS